MVKLDKIYTRGGDLGHTSLADGTRVLKHSMVIEAIGAVDETNSSIGLCRTEITGILDDMLKRIQHDLFDLGADLCTPTSGNKNEGALRIIETQITRLENEIDELNGELAPLNSFVLPGGSKPSSYLHIARTTCRMAERSITALSELQEINPLVVKYINRLSDLLFTMARYANNKSSTDVLWQPGVNR